MKIKPDEFGNYTVRQWNKLPPAKRLRWCAAGKFHIYPKDMRDAAARIETLESTLKDVEDFLASTAEFNSDEMKLLGEVLEVLYGKAVR